LYSNQTQSAYATKKGDQYEVVITSINKSFDQALLELKMKFQWMITWI